MITHALQITVLVNNQEEAKAFYTEKLGFVVRMEEEFAPGWKYLTVAPSSGSETVLELSEADTPEQEQLIGRQAADQILVMFGTDDIDRDYAAMQARGVVFHGEPKRVPGGRGVGFEDLYGNQFDLFQADPK